MVSWGGETMNMGEWAKKFGISASYCSQLIGKKGGIAPAFAFMSVGRKRELANNLVEYTGPDFVTDTGEEITTGRKETFAGWAKLTGIPQGTIRSREARGNMSFNDALRAPVRRFVPLRSMKPGRFQPRFTTPKPARSTLSILSCRARNPGQRCAECGAKSDCYGGLSA